MKAEITRENKTKFFGLYVSQTIMRSNYNPNWLYNVDSTIFSQSIDDKYLELKSLSDISDEGAIEVAKILDPNKLEGEWTEILKYKSVFTDLINTENESEGLTHVSILHVFDFLRSRGYLVPWMGLYCEELIEAGWAKYKQE